MKAFEFTTIGIVRNSFQEPEDYRKIKEKPSEIEVFEEFGDALLGIEENDYLDIVFYFHKSEKKLLTSTVKRPPDELRGVFATRSSKRPNLVGVTTVKLLERKGNRLVVQGFDAIDGTPVLDIKNCDTSLFAYEYDNNPVHRGKLKTSPRIDIRNEIHSNRTESLMIKAGQMHGHFCPGLAQGVMAATYAMNKMEAESDGMEGLLAITETNNCFSDGVQFVTGCTFGNNSLIYRDLGKMAFTLTKRDGKGLRISSKPDARDVIGEMFSGHEGLYKKVVEERSQDPSLMAAYKKSALDRSFGTLSIEFNKLFDVKYVLVKVPEYAKIVESVICTVCSESIMITRTERKGEGYVCLDCGGYPHGVVDGNGISCR